MCPFPRCSESCGVGEERGSRVATGCGQKPLPRDSARQEVGQDLFCLYLSFSKGAGIPVTGSMWLPGASGEKIVAKLSHHGTPACCLLLAHGDRPLPPAPEIKSGFVQTVFPAHTPQRGTQGGHGIVTHFPPCLWGCWPPWLKSWCLPFPHPRLWLPLGDSHPHLELTCSKTGAMCTHTWCLRHRQPTDPEPPLPAAQWP